MALAPDTAGTAAQDRFAVDTAAPMPGAGGGVPAFVARDRSDPAAEPLMALRVEKRAPMRFAAAAWLQGSIEGVLVPLGTAEGPAADGAAGRYLVCQAPPGPALSTARRVWSEAALLGSVLRPVAQALLALEQRGVTHRAIRLDNVFVDPDGRVVLGAAWAEPPAMRQPALFEPPYSAICHPAGRGDGTIADDVYALGVLLVCLATGRVPLDGADAETVVQRKLSMGTYGALVGETRLPSAIADIVRTMLAEDPDHRPPPALLLDPVAARGRRIAFRPPARASAPLRIGDISVWDARTLGYAVGTRPEAAVAALRAGEVATWLRRPLGDVALAVRYEELWRHRHTEGPVRDARADAATAMRAVALTDPLAPLCWRGVAFWPDGIGALLAHARDAEPDTLDAAADAVAGEVAVGWATLNADRHDLTAIRVAARDQRGLLRGRGPSGGLPRLIYASNPSLPCASPRVAAHWADTPAELLRALDAAAVRGRAEGDPIDPDVAAFIAARTERRLVTEINALNGRGDAATRLMAQMRVLAALQARYYPHPLPGLAKWLAAGGGPLVALWHNRPKREAVAAQMNALAEQGALAPLLALIEDAGERARDATGAASAAFELAVIEHELEAVGRGGPARRAYAERIGQEIAAGVGLAALAASLCLAALG